MKSLLSFDVAPRIPDALGFLETLANNLWWSWNVEATSLFRRIDPALWKKVRCNPLMLLNRVSQARLEALAEDAAFLSQLENVATTYHREVCETAQYIPESGAQRCIAYFSLEYGLNENIRLYSGGLGVLAGDHLKSASDLDLPLVAVGLMYEEGYFQQQLDEHGQQTEAYPKNDLHSMPASRALSAEGKPFLVTVMLPEGRLFASVWRIDVGRIPLFLLDTNIPENPPHYRSITGRLYGSDPQTRLRQELLLGIGGFRILKPLGYEAAVCHMNEGHAAFLALARLEHLQKDFGLEPEVAFETVRRTTVFTTHTPVPAGNETFKLDLLIPHLATLEREMGIPSEDVIAWGCPPQQAADTRQELSMTILGIRTARYTNGVSELHGEVEREMWSHLWPDIPEDEVPIHHITNGIHLPTWLSPELGQLYTRYLGPDWLQHADDPEVLARVELIPDEDLWRHHEMGRSHLIRCAREQIERQLIIRNAPRSCITESRAILDQDALTIGFARRFATYKRATLLLQNIERIEAILADQNHPVQLIFAGKAHPADQYAKDFIRQVVDFTRRSKVCRRAVFLEDYDMYLARHLVRGVDVWLNTPRRPHEASGTSGMKVCINGGIHLSVLDGWWCEGYSPECGWAFGEEEIIPDEGYQDYVDAQALYNLLENEVVPCFYDRPGGDVPTRWVKMMKASIRMSLHAFSSTRMVQHYKDTAYVPAMYNYDELLRNGAEKARACVKRHAAYKTAWPDVRVSPPRTSQPISESHVGDSFDVTTRVTLCSLEPEDVDVEIYYGPLNPHGLVTESHVLLMKLLRKEDDGTYTYGATVVCGKPGRFGCTARVTPCGDEWEGIMPGYICWADAEAEAQS